MTALSSRAQSRDPHVNAPINRPTNSLSNSPTHSAAKRPLQVLDQVLRILEPYGHAQKVARRDRRGALDGCAVLDERLGTAEARRTGEELEAVGEIERRLLGLRDDRERLGAVNLRADEEAAEVAKQLETLILERDDLVAAIHKLRGAISSLNREGRQRLLDAFCTVNQKFGELFVTLFGGGKAELQLIESDDPLEAGLEIVDAWAEAPAGAGPGPVADYLEVLTEVHPGDDPVVLPPLVTVVARRH